MSEHLHTTDRTLHGELMAQGYRELVELHAQVTADATDAVTGSAADPQTAVVIAADGKTVVLAGDTFDQLGNETGRRRLAHEYGALPDGVVAAFTHPDRIVLDARSW